MTLSATLLVKSHTNTLINPLSLISPRSAVSVRPTADDVSTMHVVLFTYHSAPLENSFFLVYQRGVVMVGRISFSFKPTCTA